MKILFATLALLFTVLFLPGTRAYITAQQKRSEQLYFNLGIATLRLMDPALRQGVAVDGAWSLKER